MWSGIDVRLFWKPPDVWFTPIAKVKWKTDKKSVVSIAKKKGNIVTLKARKKGTAVVTATYKKKKYKCRITVREKKKQAERNGKAQLRG